MNTWGSKRLSALGLLKWQMEAGKNGERLRITGRQDPDPEGPSMQKR